MIKKLLIANRGEIVRRIARTARRMGVSVATVHSQADRDAMHVHDVGESIAIGPAPSSQSYLNVEAILSAARKVGADAIHPGIGFLSEDFNFAAAVEAAGMIFVGPRPDTMRRFADKWSAKFEARQSKVSIIGGSEGATTDVAALIKLVSHDMRLPVMLKAAAGGGGRGVRVVRSLDNLQSVIESAMREAQSSFGRPDLIVEEFVENARHLEVQVAGDGKGEVIHLFERECSLQRRFQKVIEEAPSVNVPPAVLKRLLADAVNLAKSVKYRNLGTMEFLVSGDRHYFLECNPRLQVEHTVTEEVTGVDLVELQLKIAAEERLPLTQAEINLSGHAIQARIYAEDAAAGFMPSTGTLTQVEFPKSIRIETAVAAGSEITPYYDAMIAKMIAHGADREAALNRLTRALEETVIFGVETNRDFLIRLLSDPVVRTGTADNRFIDTQFDLAPAPAPYALSWGAIAAAILLLKWNSSNSASIGLWGGGFGLLGWRYSAGRLTQGGPTIFTLTTQGESWPISLGTSDMGHLNILVADQSFFVAAKEVAPGRYDVDLEAESLAVTADVRDTEIRLQDTHGHVLKFAIVPFLTLEAALGSQSGQVRAPMMGVISKIKVAVGEVVHKGDVLAVMESMKMEMMLSAPCDGVVSALNCSEQQTVERNEIIAEVVAS